MSVCIPVRLQAWQVAILVILEDIDGLCIGSHGKQQNLRFVERVTRVIRLC